MKTCPMRSRRWRRLTPWRFPLGGKARSAAWQDQSAPEAVSKTETLWLNARWRYWASGPPDPPSSALAPVKARFQKLEPGLLLELAAQPCWPCKVPIWIFFWLPWGFCGQDRPVESCGSAFAQLGRSRAGKAAQPSGTRRDVLSAAVYLLALRSKCEAA